MKLIRILFATVFIPAVFSNQFHDRAIQNVDQQFLGYVGKNLQVIFEVLNNTNGNDTYFEAAIHLINTGNTDISNGNWEIYFYCLFMLEPDHLTVNNSYEVPQTGIQISHVNGILFKMEPTENFNTLVADGERLTMNLVISFWSVSRSDVMPRWYITSPGLNPVVITSTENINSKFVVDFTKPSQYKRYSYDEYQPYTAEERFNRFDQFDANAEPKLIIPTPWKTKVNGKETTTITNQWRIVCQNFTRECDYLSGRLELVITNEKPTTLFVLIQQGEVVVDSSLIQNESYNLHVESGKIELTSPTSAGAFYAIQSLLSLADSNKGNIPFVDIVDAPRFGYRGMHLDVARNFVKKEDVISLIKVMAMYKLNKFHFHLTDDEGWRVEMNSCPELTLVGGQRLHDLSESTGIIPQLGSGPNSDTSGSGYYSKSEYQEILKVAEENHIQVIPEVDLPGHAHAAIKANLAYFHRLMENNEENPEEVLISDLNDTSKYLSVQLFNDNAVNPCIKGTYLFVQNIVKDFVDLHSNYQKLTMIHLGGDEIAGAWEDSPKCEELYKGNQFPSGAPDLLEYFWQNATCATNEAVEDHLVIGVWEDGILGKTEDKDIPYDKDMLCGSDIVAYAWQNIWEWGVSNRAYVLANAGYKVVLSPATHLYFDQPYEPDPEERGLYWASRFTDNAKVFSFMPDDFYSNADVKRSGAAYPEESVCSDYECTPLEQSENIIGIQGQLWSETLRNRSHFHYMIFPRLLPLSERAWHKATWESTDTTTLDPAARDSDWASFAVTLGKKELARLDANRIEYRVPLPGARIQGKQLFVACEFPGMTVRYRKTYEETWRETECPGSLPYKIGEEYELQTVSVASSERRFSRSIFAIQRSGSNVVAASVSCIFAGVVVAIWNSF